MILNGVTVTLDPSGALYVPREGTLVAADLHFEKGSSYAAKGQPLPPYDTAATLRALAAVIERHRPTRVICLGDSFHDDGAGGRMNAADAATVRALTADRDWIWITGNHDPHPPEDLGGRIEREVMLDGLRLQHEPRVRAAAGQIAGHLHPKASVRVRGRRIQRRCFASDGLRLILPSFGAYTGGLSVLDRAFAKLFPGPFHAHMISNGHIRSVPSRRLV